MHTTRFPLLILPTLIARVLDECVGLFSPDEDAGDVLLLTSRPFGTHLHKAAQSGTQRAVVEVCEEACLRQKATEPLKRGTDAQEKARQVLTLAVTVDV
jgi:hypothetical protein